MPGVSQIVFCAMQLTRETVAGRRVLDVGACDFNGSIRPLVESWGPSQYIGVDIKPGPRVDAVCYAEELVQKFGAESFDIVLCIEMLEHTPSWREAVSNLKNVVRPGGLLIITTRSLGYPCHGFPHDFWRYEVEDFRRMFADMTVRALTSDYAEPGVFLCAEKPAAFQEADLSSLELYSVLTNKRERVHSDAMYREKYFRRLAMKQRIKSWAGNSFLFCGRMTSRLLGVRTR